MVLVLQVHGFSGHAPVKLQMLLYSMILVLRNFHDMGGESASNAVTDLQTYFGCAVPEHVVIHPPLCP